MLSKLSVGTTQKLIDARCRSTDKPPRMEYCQDQIGTIIYIRALQGHSQWSQPIQKSVVVFETDTVEFQDELYLGEWSVGRRF